VEFNKAINDEQFTEWQGKEIFTSENADRIRSKILTEGCRVFDAVYVGRVGYEKEKG
jgi:hypothetical protein